MIINTSNASWQKELLQAQISLYISQIRKSIIDIILDAYEKAIDEYYAEYETSIYPRTYDFYDLPIEFEPVIYGNSVEIGIYLDKHKLTHGYWESPDKRFSGYHHSYDNDVLLIMEILHSEHGGQSDKDTNIIEKIENDSLVFNSIVNEVKNGFKKNGFIVK